MAIFEHAPSDVGLRVIEEWQHEYFRIPEHVPFIAFARLPLGGNRALSIPAGGHEQMHGIEVYGVLQRAILGQGHESPFTEERDILALLALERVVSKLLG